MSIDAINPSSPSFPQSPLDPRAGLQSVQRHPVRFTGSGSEYFRIWIVNLLLTLVTLTLYYPWAKVRKLRYFYGNTQVAGHALDFHGEPQRMLRGYLLVGVLLLVYNFAFQVSPTAALIALGIMAGVWPLLFRTSQRFRLVNTSWRGLRFSFGGDVPGAYQALLPAFVPAILMFLVLAVLDPSAPGHAAHQTQFGLWFGAATLVSMLAMPLMWWAIKRYQHAHYRLVQERTSFSAGVGSFYGLFAKVFGLFLLAMLVFVVLSAVLGVAGSRLGSPTALMGVIGVLVGLLYIGSILLLQPFLLARLQNLLWNQTRSPAIGFESTLSARSMLWLNVKNWLLILLTLGLYWPFAAVATARMRLEAVTVLAHQDLDELLASERLRMKDATGDVAADVFDIDMGL